MLPPISTFEERLPGAASLLEAWDAFASEMLKRCSPRQACSFLVLLSTRVHLQVFSARQLRHKNPNLLFTSTNVY
jgi:hypothetical protein